MLFAQKCDDDINASVPSAQHTKSKKKRGREREGKERKEEKEEEKK